ncbi:TadE/TadG family type IV pilus assembly protein [Aureimonas mangrovi]|uniref:TadE/TadG family type IV pilus assembly protein n=1 Tax=Aureimonas mangrovi TaxID=2758041 RepID=UPI00163DBC3B|nr:TadE/TadG family type IV pilus assembly protein [Aureimonas mangrovi]
MSNRKKPVRKARFTSDTRGVAAIEFAFIAPLLILILFGCISFFQFYRTGLALDRATATVSDLMSRQETLSSSYLDRRIKTNLSRLVGEGIQPLEMRVSSLTMDGGSYRVDWTYPRTAGPGFAGRALPMDILPRIANGDSVLLTETTITQQALIDVAGVPQVSHNSTAAVRPRFYRQIAGPY